MDDLSSVIAVTIGLATWIFLVPPVFKLVGYAPKYISAAIYTLFAILASLIIVDDASLRTVFSITFGGTIFLLYSLEGSERFYPKGYLISCSVALLVAFGFTISQSVWFN